MRQKLYRVPHPRGRQCRARPFPGWRCHMWTSDNRGWRLPACRMTHGTHLRAIWLQSFFGFPGGRLSASRMARLPASFMSQSIHFLLLLAQFRIFRVGLELLIDLPQHPSQLRPHGTQPFLRHPLFLRNWAIKPEFPCLGVDNDVVWVGNWLWPCGATAGALSEDSAPMFFLITRLRQLEFPLRTNTEHYDL